MASSARRLGCLLKSEMGQMHRVAVPWVSGPPLRQLEELAAWGETLKSGMIVLFSAHGTDVHMEGNYWLALINGPAYPVPESQASDVHPIALMPFADTLYPPTSVGFGK